MMNDHEQIKHINPYNLSFTNLPLAFSLFITKIVKLSKITNMHCVSLNHFLDFILVLNCIRNHPIKNECFCMDILFTTIYLLHKQELNHGNFSEQEIKYGKFCTS
jgi:glycerol-3-phosphate acyltransferase PlsY